MSLTVLYVVVHPSVILYYAPDYAYFAVHSTVILYYAPDCTVFCSPYHSDIILCPLVCCILQSIPQWYYTMPFSVLYFAVHTTVILYYAPDCIVFCSPYHSDIILCPLLYCILQSIPQCCGMDCKIQYSQGHSIIPLWYGLQDTAQSGA
jgi:hypothetical protein